MGEERNRKTPRNNKRKEKGQKMKYTKQELRHLKYRLMKQEKLTEKEATLRIKDLLEITDKNHIKTKNGGKKRKN